MSPAEMITAIVVAALGSSWVGNALVNRFGRSSNRAIMTRLDGIEKKVDQNEITRIRVRILEFNVELMRHELHTREDFIDILSEINTYESYCKAHADYSNNRAVMAIANIKRVYEKCMEDNSFL